MYIPKVSALEKSQGVGDKGYVMFTNILSLENLESMTIHEYLSIHLPASDTSLLPCADQGSTHSLGLNVLYLSMIHVQVLSKLPKPTTLGKYCGLFHRK